MDTLQALKKEIKKAKTKLLKQKEKFGLTENFGRTESRKLDYKFGLFSFAKYKNEYERGLAIKLIQEFDEWCSNLSL